jgi:hypothetical protein
MGLPKVCHFQDRAPGALPMEGHNHLPHTAESRFIKPLWSIRPGPKPAAFDRHGMAQPLSTVRSKEEECGSNAENLADIRLPEQVLVKASCASAAVAVRRKPGRPGRYETRLGSTKNDIRAGNCQPFS